MNQPHDTERPTPHGDPRDIAKWTRIYAQNRILPVAVNMSVFVLLSLAIGASSYLGARALREENMILLGIGIVVLSLAVTTLIYLSIPRWGGRRMEQIAKWCYAKEGNVAVSSEKPSYPPRAPGFLIGGMMLCVAASVILGVLGYIPARYMQPVSALYLVPFLVILTFLIRPAVGWLVLLWPALYAVHAVLIVAGVPILFEGKWESLNMLIPVAGYGLLTSLVGHTYSRLALHKVKRLAQMELPTSSRQHTEAQP